MTAQPVDTTDATLPEIELLHRAGEHDLDDPLGQVVALHCNTEPSAVALQRVTEFCRVCAEAYVTDAAWSQAAVRQRLSWTRLEMKRQGPDRTCTSCIVAAEAQKSQVIERYRADVAGAVALDPTASKVTVPASRHDANGGTTSGNGTARRRTSYEALIAQDPRAAAMVAYAEVTAALPVAPGRWVDDGVCQNADDIDFFPTTTRKTAEAKQRCLSCPVLVQCLDYALRNPKGASDGVWCGTSAKDRRLLRKTARKDATSS